MSEPITLGIPVRFQRPLTPEHWMAIEEAAQKLHGHNFELHDFGPDGESITRINVREHIIAIEPLFDEADLTSATMRFAVSSKQDREALIWASSLLFQYIHYTIARIATINNAAHTLDWEAQQDPQAPQRIKEWVDSGQSLVERMSRRSS